MQDGVETTKKTYEPREGVVASRDLKEADLLGARGQGEAAIVDGRPGVLMGSYGVIVDVIENTGALAIEFFDAQGRTIDIGYVRPDDVRHATSDEIEKAGKLATNLSAP